MSVSLNGPALWYTTRATGLVTLLLLTASVLLGLLITGRFTSDKWPRFLTVIDTFVHIPLVSAFIPFTSSYQPFWLSLGAVALDLLIALVATSLIRNRLGLRAWRWLHWAAYVCWPVALAHGLGMGTDRNTMWVFALTIVCAAAVAGAATWRFVTAARAGAR